MFLSVIVFVLTSLASVLVIVKNKPKTVELYAICSADKSKLSFGSFDGITLVNETFLGFDDNRHYYCDDLEVYDGFIEYFTNDNNIKCEGNTHDRSTFVYLYNGMYYGVEMLHLVNGEGETFHIKTYSFVSLEDGCLVPTFYGFSSYRLFGNERNKIGRSKYEMDYTYFFTREDLNPLKLRTKIDILNFYRNIDHKYLTISDNVITFKNLRTGFDDFTMTLSDDSLIVESIEVYHDDIESKGIKTNELTVESDLNHKSLSLGMFDNLYVKTDTSKNGLYLKFLCENEEKFNEILTKLKSDENNIKCDNKTFVYLYEGMYYGVICKSSFDVNQNKIYEILTYSFESYDRKLVPTFYGSYSDIFTNSKFYDSEKKKYIVPYDKMFEIFDSNIDLNPLKIRTKEEMLSFYNKLGINSVEVNGDVVKCKDCDGDFIEKITFYDTYLEVEKM